MVIAIPPKKVLVFLLRNFNENNTVSSLAKELSMNRVGIWRILKKLESQNLVKLIAISDKKTSTYIVKLNWNNILLERLFLFYLTEEALKQETWLKNLKRIEDIVDFLILHENNVISIIPNKRIKIHQASELQEGDKKINAINLIELEFMQELNTQNQTLVDAVKKGNVLFGQEKFINFMKNMHLKKFNEF